ncbi:GntR family transcriptional regulator [Allorhizobium taibaishanense]|uniref:DNA-binding GntR family transcriptional regulator n=1 Tax=Allorhizobium taibaishanense TaxID=887144 RepID=A0A1Q9A9A6_9HYPH|nr:GntR family transcriptional regulator [Allorhizobium taibaishanense]MBB4009817.1 DNA-binding GntR family transcriptional regulator [Allorhizobium taibaishanense]OLP51460.1 hypothetical protein BJF91_15505 [Allorhizobium taibaishanense]
MKSNALYKRSYNSCLDLIGALAPGERLASEPALAKALGISRTTLRAVLAEMDRQGLIQIEAGIKRLLRAPCPEDYLAGIDLEPLSAMVERKFMAWMAGPDCHPGKPINGLDLARQFAVSTSAIRDCLNRFSHFGLLERQSNGRWTALGLTVDFVSELFDMRELMELRAVDRFVTLPKEHPAWAALSDIEQAHHALQHDFDRRYRDFSELDDRLHRLVNGVAPNRFLGNIQGVMSVIFHYHYQWNKRDEKERNRVAIVEHLAYIAGMKSGNGEQARQACALHLHTARATLLSSIKA